MKKLTTLTGWLVMAAALTIATTACSSEDSIADEPTPATTETPKTYTMTVTASKGDDATTRALSLDGTTLNATWAEGDVVEIWSSDGSTVNYGELTAQSAGQTTTLTGTLTGIMPTVNTSLLLKYRSNDYSSQTGTLDYIAQNCDYATARVKVTSVSGSEITTTAASFENQQAIVKFTLKDSDGKAISAWKLTVSDGTNTYTVTPASDTSELFVAIPSISSQTLTLTANAGFATYTYEKSDVTFTNGKYYAVTVKMAAVRTLAEATAEDIGKVAGADGKIYANVAAAKAASTTACAIIAYVGSETGEASPYNHGLAIAMKDASAGYLQWKISYGSNDNPNQYTDPASAIAAKESGSALSAGRNNSTWPAFEAALANSITASDGISAAAPASGTSGWFLPSLYQWNMIVKGLSGQSADLSYDYNDNYTASSLNTKIEAAGADGLQSGVYWSSTEFDGSNAWLFRANLGDVYGSRIRKDFDIYVRSAFAF